MLKITEQQNGVYDTSGNICRKSAPCPHFNRQASVWKKKIKKKKWIFEIFLRSVSRKAPATFIILNNNLGVSQEQSSVLPLKDTFSLCDFKKQNVVNINICQGLEPRRFVLIHGVSTSAWRRRTTNRGKEGHRRPLCRWLEQQLSCGGLYKPALAWHVQGQPEVAARAILLRRPNYRLSTWTDHVWTVSFACRRTAKCMRTSGPARGGRTLSCSDGPQTLSCGL